MPNKPRRSDSQTRPPFGSWRRMYAVVLATDAFLIVLFYFFTVYFE